MSSFIQDCQIGIPLPQEMVNGYRALDLLMREDSPKIFCLDKTGIYEIAENSIFASRKGAVYKYNGDTGEKVGKYLLNSGFIAEKLLSVRDRIAAYNGKESLLIQGEEEIVLKNLKGVCSYAGELFFILSGPGRKFRLDHFNLETKKLKRIFSNFKFSDSFEEIFRKDYAVSVYKDKILFAGKKADSTGKIEILFYNPHLQRFREFKINALPSNFCGWEKHTDLIWTACFKGNIPQFQFFNPYTKRIFHPLKISNLKMNKSDKAVSPIVDRNFIHFSCENSRIFYDRNKKKWQKMWRGSYQFQGMQQSSMLQMFVYSLEAQTVLKFRDRRTNELFGYERKLANVREVILKGHRIYWLNAEGFLCWENLAASMPN